MLLRVATLITADPATAQDVVQSVFERAFRDWDRISRLENPGAYVRRMVTNEAISSRRRGRRIVLTDEPPEPAPHPDVATRIGDSDQLIAALRRLPPKLRAAIALRYYLDLPDAQVADAMGCRETTVRGYVLRGLRRLRIELDDDPAARPNRFTPPTTLEER